MQRPGKHSENKEADAEKAGTSNGESEWQRGFWDRVRESLESSQARRGAVVVL